MTRWFIGTNNFYYKGDIILEEAPWYIFVIERLSEIICSYIPQIPLPKIKIKKDNEIYTLRSYYGTISDLFHIFVHVKIFQWCYKKIKIEYIHFPYQMLVEIFPDKIFETNYNYDDEDKFEIQKNKIISEEIYKEFEDVYKKLEIKI